MTSKQVFWRQQLNTPILQRHFLVFCLTPVLFGLALIWGAIAWLRRKRGYKHWPLRNNSDTQSKNNQFTRPIIVCVGNIIVGASGKSPIVRNLAKSFLNKGYHVVILSRGIGTQPQPRHPNATAFINASTWSKKQELPSILSDENRELLYLLTDQGTKQQQLYFAQDKKRLRALYKIKNYFEDQQHDLRNVIIIMDDGLQAFSCPRDKNLCVWTPSLFKTAARWSLPLGPYREGFPWNFKSFFNFFSFHMWSRVSNSIDAKNNTWLQIKTHLQHNTLQDHLLVVENLSFYKISSNIDSNLLPELFPIKTADFAKTLQHQNESKIYSILGIGQPERFLDSLKNHFASEYKDILTSILKISFIYLDDHSSWNIDNAKNIPSNACLLFSAKDFFRWYTNKDFKDFIKSKTCYLVQIETKIENPEDTSSNLADRLDFEFQNGLLRNNVAVLIKYHDKYLACLRSNVTAWQCVQGGIEEVDGGDLQKSVIREIKEELGWPAERIKIAYESHFWRRYYFPADIQPRVGQNFIGQRQKWFLAEVDAPYGLDTAAADSEFADTKWVSIDELLALYSTWKQPVFRDFCREIGLIK